MRESRSGWLFLGFMAAVAVALTVLQYRWTGEISEVQADRARADLSVRLQQASDAFASDLRSQVKQLLPLASDLDTQGWERAHLDRIHAWKGADDYCPLFSRIAVARPTQQKTLELFEAKGDRFVRIEWPPEWADFRESATRRVGGGEGPPPNRVASLSDLIEVPVFGDGAEKEWMLFGLDEAYLGNVRIPALYAAHLDTASFALWIATSNGDVLFGEGKTIPATKPDGSVGIFPSNFLRDGRGRGGDRNRWTLSAWHRDGTLEAAVATARWRNLAVASLLLALIIASGAALLRFTRQSHEAAEAERRFFAGVSHELRTPLTAIRAAGQNLQDNVVREEAQKQQYVGIIVRHAEQLSDIVDQVLHYAAASKAHARPQGEVDIASVIESAREAAGFEIRAAKSDVELDVPDLLPPVQGDASALRRLFQNLIGNAARHGGEGHSIRVEASESEGFVEVKVLDRGPGIPADELPRIFDAFFRGARARSKQTRGAGIGLSLVREIAEAHGGKVTASNRKGGGAVFAVRLPAARTAREEEEEAAAP